MSPAFIVLQLLPLIPIFLGIMCIVHLTIRRHIPYKVLVTSFIKLVFAWGFICAAAFYVFAAINLNGPQAPLMLLFVPAPLALGELVGLVVWARKVYAT